MVAIKQNKVVIKNNEYHEISKDNILNLVTEDEIYRHYIGHDYEECVPFKSPLKEKDDNPSFNIYTNSHDQLVFTDFSLGITGDVFKFVELLPEHRGRLSGLWQTCCKINYDMKLGLGSKGQMKLFTTYKKPVVVPREGVKLQIKHQDMTSKDLAYWYQYGITKDTLKKYCVFSAEKVFRNGVEFCKYSLSNPIYAYYFHDTNRLKIYRPLEEKRHKWMQTYSTKETLQGMSQLPDTGHLLIITKSLKDVMALYELGFNAIAPLSEGQMITAFTINLLSTRFDKIVVLYDNDDTGKTTSAVLKRLYNLDTIFMKSAKDVSDCIKKIGKNDTKIELINIIEENEQRNNKKEDNSKTGKYLDLPFED